MNVFTNQQLIQQDTEHLIHPLHHQGMHSNGLVWVRGKGAILEDADGKEYLDGLAGLWNNTAGHGQQTLVDAASQQMATLPYASGYTGSTNPKAIELAERLSEMMYPKINHFSSLPAEASRVTAISRWQGIIGSSKASRRKPG